MLDTMQREGVPGAEALVSVRRWARAAPLHARLGVAALTRPLAVVRRRLGPWPLAHTSCRDGTP